MSIETATTVDVLSAVMKKYGMDDKSARKAAEEASRHLGNLYTYTVSKCMVEAPEMDPVKMEINNLLEEYGTK